MNGRAVLLFALIFALVIAGLATLTPAMIVLAVPLLVYLGAGLLQQSTGASLSVARTLNKTRVEPGEPIQVSLALSNTGTQSQTLLLNDATPAGLQRSEGETRVLLTLAAGESTTVDYTLIGKRGEYRFLETSAQLSDPFGLTQLRQHVDAPGAVRVQPTAQRLGNVSIRPPRTRGFAGPIPSRQNGSGVDFFALREYQQGDRLRAINWRVTARAMTRDSRNLYTNVFEQQRIAAVGVIVDARLDSDVQTSRGALFEHTIHASASVAERLLDDGNRVGLLVYGSGLITVYPGYGRKQRERIRNMLGRVQPAYHAVFETLAYVPTRLFPAQSQIVFVGPVDAKDPATLLRLRALGYSLTIISPNPILFELETLPAITPGSPAELALRLTKAERSQRLTVLRRAGCQVVDWDVNTPLDVALRDALTRRTGQQRVLGGLG